MRHRMLVLMSLFTITGLILTLLPNQVQAQEHPLVVFNDPNYSGAQCYSVSPRDAAIHPTCDDQISSIQLQPGWSVLLYPDQAQGGSSVCLSRSDANLANNTFENGTPLDDAITSFSLFNTLYCGGSPVPAYPFEVYNDLGYAVNTPDSWCYSAYAQAANIHNWCNERISSILLRTNWSVRVYRDTGLNGPDTCIPTSDADLSDNTFSDGSPLKDAISSFVLFAEPNCGGAAPPDSDALFGDGQDGDLMVNAGQTFVINTTMVNVTASGASAAPANSSGFLAGDRVLFHQTQGTANVGRWEINQIAAINTPTNWTLESPLTYTYDNTLGQAQVIRIPQYENVTIQPGGMLKAPDWDGNVGGILIFMVSQTLDVLGTISMNGGNGLTASSGSFVPGGQGGGYWGGTGDMQLNDCQGGGGQGEGTLGKGAVAQSANGNGAGGGHYNNCNGAAGGGGGNGTAGGNSTRGFVTSGIGGATAGNPELTSLVFGGGGGGASDEQGRPGGTGGAGGGAMLLFANNLAVTGSIVASGGNGGGSSSGGGGGAGGSIFVKTNVATIGTNLINAPGGSGGPSAGAGGTGRIRIEYCTSLAGTTSNPPASNEQVNCAPPSAISAITPNSAVANAGNVPLIIQGVNLQTPLTARIGNVDLLDVVIETPNIAHAVVPIGSLPQGTYDLTVVSNGVTTTLPGAFIVTPPVPVTQFRVMVYLACDARDIEASCETLFNELELAMTYHPDLRIAAFWDGNTVGDSAYYLIQPDDDPYELAQYKKDLTYFPIGEANTGTPNTLVKFASWAQSRYPGVYRMLSMVGHGGGWAPDLHPGQPQGFIGNKANNEVGGMLWDTASSSTLATAPLADALDWITRAYPIDVLYLDSCLMGAVEVAMEIQASADYLIANENLSWAVHPYANYLRNVNGTTTPRDLAIRVAQVGGAALPKEGYPSQVGVVDLSRMVLLAAAVNNLGSQLTQAVPGYRVAITNAAVQAARVNNKDIDQMIIDTNDQTLDLYDFSTQLIAQPALPQGVKDAAQQVMTALDDAMVVNYFKNGMPWTGRQFWDLSKLHGLSIYFPLVDDWKRVHYGPDALPRFAQGTWDEFIQAWYQGQTAPDFPTTPCNNCPFTPSHIALQVVGPATAKLGQLIYISLTLTNVASTDDLRGLQAKLISSDPGIIAPAGNLKARISDFFPDDDYVQGVSLIDGWSVIANVPGTKLDPASGSGVVIEFPFYALREGCVRMQITDHLLVNGHVPAQRLAHQLSEPEICVGGARTASVIGTLYLEARTTGSFGGATVTLSAKNGATYTTVTAPDGSYAFDKVPEGSYVARFIHPLYLATERSVTVKANEGTIVAPVGLWGGDLEQSGAIELRDWRMCAAGARIHDPAFDLDADGSMDVGDCAIVARNSGRKSSQKDNPPLPHLATGVSHLGARVANAPVLDQIAASIRLVLQDDGSLVIRVIGQHEPFYAAGLRLALPQGATLLEVQGRGMFADEVIHTHETADAVYVIAALEGAIGAQDTDIARLQFYLPPGTTLQDIQLEAAGLITEAGMGSKSTTFLPFVLR